jgi:hypothetical protein
MSCPVFVTHKEMRNTIMKLYFLIVATLVLFSSPVLAVDEPSPAQIEAIHQREKQIAPFDVDQAIEMFSKTVHGGVQHIVVKSADNTKQIKLIQEYLLKITNSLNKGDFSETERIHGANMPGLARLKKAEPYDIKFEYEALPNGAQIHFSTEYPQYAQALHEWFDAQQKEHKNEVIQEHSKHHLTPTE